MRDLGDGLIMRRATVEDTEALTEFDVLVLSHTDERAEEIRIWTRSLMAGRLHTFQPGDFTIVEDTRTGAIVSSLNLLSQTWSFGGIEFGAGFVNLVGTHPDYRRRGLIRAQMEVVHEWSTQRGEPVQVVGGGLPWYYRQFGYELALEALGGRAGYLPNVPQLQEGEKEPYSFRSTTEKDLPFIMRLYKQGMQRYLVSSVRDEALWLSELKGRTEKDHHRHEMRVIEEATGEPVGLLFHFSTLSGHTTSENWPTGPQDARRIVSRTYELLPSASWVAVTPSVIRYLERTGKEYAARDKVDNFGGFYFEMGTDHPVYHAAKDRLPRAVRPYAWYVRVPDVSAFVRRVAPVLEERLAGSVLAGHTGELRMSFATDGLRLSFESGRLVRADRWLPLLPSGEMVREPFDALLPGLTFLLVLFGSNSPEELEAVFPDLMVGSNQAREMLNILFPKQASQIWGVE